MHTAALDGALLVFHPGSGTTVALTDALQQVFVCIREQRPLDDASLAIEMVDDCLRLLRQHQLIQAMPA